MAYASRGYPMDYGNKLVAMMVDTVLAHERVKLDEAVPSVESTPHFISRTKPKRTDQLGQISPVKDS